MSTGEQMVFCGGLSIVIGIVGIVYYSRLIKKAEDLEVKEKYKSNRSAFLGFFFIGIIILGMLFYIVWLWMSSWPY